MADDIYQVRSMMAALRTLKPASSFFLDTFFRGAPIEWITEAVQIDVETNTQKLAPFVNYLASAKAQPRDGFETVEIKPPYVKPMRESNAANYLKRNPGESIYSGITIAQRAAALMAKDLAEMNLQIDRTEEWLAAQQLANGSVLVVGEGVSATIDFRRSATHNIAAGALSAGAWNVGTPSPLTDLRTARQLILSDSGHGSEIVAVFGVDAWGDFLKSAEVRDFLNVLHIVPGSVAPQAPMVGGRYMGNVEGIDLWMYSDWYTDSAGAKQPMIPTDYVIVGATQTRAERNYGAIMDDEAVFPMRRWPTSWVERNPKIRYVMIESAPLPVAHEPDAFVRLDTRA